MITSLFDNWPDAYDQWFTTPTGQLVKKYEARLLLELLAPLPGMKILDVGCGTGIFTQDVLDCGAEIIGIDLSVPMLKNGLVRFEQDSFFGLCADMCALPFADNSFDNAFSMTAIEFVDDAPRVVDELHRVTRKGGRIVVTTLNSLSPWAKQRKKKAAKGHTLFQNIFFRSPAEMRSMVSGKCVIETAIHFEKNDPITTIPEIEANGRKNNLDTGAFLAIQWIKN